MRAGAFIFHQITDGLKSKRFPALLITDSGMLSVFYGIETLKLII
jgi:hypothetical protein